MLVVKEFLARLALVGVADGMGAVMACATLPALHLVRVVEAEQQISARGVLD
jgi:hypothetical protein